MLFLKNDNNADEDNPVHATAESGGFAVFALFVFSTTP
jgi:hypothetical protein